MLVWYLDEHHTKVDEKLLHVNSLDVFDAHVMLTTCQSSFMTSTLFFLNQVVKKENTKKSFQSVLSSIKGEL